MKEIQDNVIQLKWCSIGLNEQRPIDLIYCTQLLAMFSIIPLCSLLNDRVCFKLKSDNDIFTPSPQLKLKYIQRFLQREG